MSFIPWQQTSSASQQKNLQEVQRVLYHPRAEKDVKCKPPTMTPKRYTRYFPMIMEPCTKQSRQKLLFQLKAGMSDVIRV